MLSSQYWSRLPQTKFKLLQLIHLTIRVPQFCLPFSISVYTKWTAASTNVIVFFSRYNEVCNPGYNFNGGGSSGVTGHFTQVVWKESTTLGIGRAEVTKNGMKCAYIVARYKPAGNFMGRYTENVPKGKFNANIHCSSVPFGFDQQEQAARIDAPMSTVDVPVEKTGSAEFRGSTDTDCVEEKCSY